MKKVIVKKYRFGYSIIIYCDINTFNEMISTINYRVRNSGSLNIFHVLCGKSEFNFIICNSALTYESEVV